MIPFAVFTGLGVSAAIVKGVHVHARIAELLEIERAYYHLTEKDKWHPKL
jgi:hypothetical protein